MVKSFLFGKNGRRLGRRGDLSVKTVSASGGAVICQSGAVCAAGGE